MANDIIGVKEVQDLLKQVENLSVSVLTTASKRGAKIVQTVARSNAPVKSGLLKKSIKPKAEKRRKGKRVYQIGFWGDGLVKFSKKGKRSFYPTSQEYGWTDEHGKKHPGKRFLRNAADNNRELIKQTILKTMYDELGKLR